MASFWPIANLPDKSQKVSSAAKSPCLVRLWRCIYPFGKTICGQVCRYWYIWYWQSARWNGVWVERHYKHIFLSFYGWKGCRSMTSARVHFYISRGNAQSLKNLLPKHRMLHFRRLLPNCFYKCQGGEPCSPFTHRYNAMIMMMLLFCEDDCDKLRWGLSHI